jgi:hypothetical protein
MSSVTTWTRLELGCRRDDWNESLRARMHDPAWMLARQWQTAEFSGEDAGSPIAAEIVYRTRRLDRMKRGAEGVQNLGADRPLEVEIEREGLPMTRRLAARLGLTFEAALAGRDDLRDAFRQALPMRWEGNEKDQASDRAAGFMAAVSGRLTNASALLAGLRQNQTAAQVYAVTAYGAAHPLPAGGNAIVNGAGDALRATADRLYPASGAPPAWIDARQEYRFRVAAPDVGREIVLEAQEYYEGRLDWHAFTVDRAPNATLDPALGGRAQPDVTSRAFIPSLVKFPGRPNERWWRFEDGRVNLAALDVQRTELAHVIVSEFALVYANDWFELPLELSVGSITSIDTLRVRDSFGGEMDVPSGVDAGWAMFVLGGRAAPVEAFSVGERFLFLPPALTHGLESPALEDVRLLRDEMANMAWAVEATVQDEIGLPTSGYDLAAASDRRVRERVRRAAQEAVRTWRPYAAAIAEARTNLTEAKGTNEEDEMQDALDAAVEAEEAPRQERDEATALYESVGGDVRDLAGLPQEDTDAAIVPTYKLLTEVPRNWIPLVPRAIAGGGGQTMLQRGALPQLRGAGEGAIPQRIRARGVLLRPEVRPFYVFEEEIPRTGVHVTRTAQYSRWLDGRSHFWIGRQKDSGRGEGWSGLRFDCVQDAVRRER